MSLITREQALEYHQRSPAGKLSIRPTKPCRTQFELSLAYTPGVAEPSREIAGQPERVYDYTTKGNLVAVVSNGTAVLGLGDIGPLAAKPVMEGKAILFKRFADIDAFDIEVNTRDPEEFVRFVELLSPTFGGINLEDIRAPDCFYIERRLRERLDIPVFHDDQHGTAIIAGAGLLNALELQEKDIGEVKIVINGAGAAGIAIAEFLPLLGARPENIFLLDSRGLVHEGREDLNPYKQKFAQPATSRTSLAEVLKDADVFMGVSVGNVVTEEMVRTMAPRPIIFAMANPDPEIPYEVARRARPDAIIATGRSDYPNQINNVLGFPYIFRGALDVRARAINDEMKVAAARALAALAKEEVPEYVARAYGGQRLQFGPDYIIPKPFDQRVLVWEASAVAEAAIRSGVARRTLDLQKYRESLLGRLDRAQEVMRVIMDQARQDRKRIVFPEGDSEKVLQAVRELVREEILHPILLGNEENIRRRAEALHCSLEGVEIIDPERSPWREEFAEKIFDLRHRKGVTRREARELATNPNYFAAMMVRTGRADGVVSGVLQHYPDALRPILQIFGTKPGISKVSGVFLMLLPDRVLFFVDTSVNLEISAEDLASFAEACADLARKFQIEPRIAFLSFSNFGSVRHPEVEKVQRAVRLLKERRPDLVADGEMQADTALVPEILEEDYPFSELRGGSANILVFPDLTSGNIGYKLVERLADAEAIGPILLGLNYPAHIAPRQCDVNTIVYLAALAAIDAQERTKGGKGDARS